MSDWFECSQCGASYRCRGKKPAGGICGACAAREKAWAEANASKAGVPRERRERSARSGREGRRERREPRDRDGALLSDDTSQPRYLYALALLPWGIPILTFGGCLWFVVAAGLSGIGGAIAGWRMAPMVRLVALLIYNGAIYCVFLPIYIVLILGAAKSGPVPGNNEQAAAPAPAPAPVFVPQPQPQPRPRPQPFVPPLPPPVREQPKEGPPPRRFLPPRDVVVPMGSETITGLKGLVAYYSFEDEGNKEWAADLSGKGHHARAVGAATFCVGRKGKGVLLNGANSYVEYGDFPEGNFAANESFTLALWFQTRAATGIIVSQRHSKFDGPLIELGVIARGQLRGRVRQMGGSNPDDVGSRIAVNDGQWHHAALVRHEGTSIELYVDGALHARTQTVSSAGAITTDMRALGAEMRWLQMGIKTFNGMSSYFPGAVDEFCLFNRALTAAEVRQVVVKP
jgi:hypothetical protein